MTQDNTTTPSSEFVEEENIEQPPDAGMNDKQRKRGRGVTRGLALHKQNERNGKKLEVEIDPMLGRSLTRRGSLAVSSELGQLAPDYVWPISKKGQRRRILDEVILRLEVKLNIVNVGDIVVRGHIWRQFMRIVKGRRSYYRKVYRRYNETAKEHKPRCLDQQIWYDLCDYWATPKVQALCDKNTENRNMVQHVNCQGPIPLVPLYYELLNKEGSGVNNKIDFFRKVRCTITGEWRNEYSAEAHNRMQQKVDETKDSDQPVTADEAFHEVLGSNSGCLIGVGYGPLPPPKRVDTRALNECAQVREQNHKLTEENERLHERCGHLEENMTQVTQQNEKLTEENTRLQERCANLEENVTQVTEQNQMLTQENTRLQDRCDHLEKNMNQINEKQAVFEHFMRQQLQKGGN
ncbi:unnamed protein product [Linum trigynum]